LVSIYVDIFTEFPRVVFRKFSTDGVNNRPKDFGIEACETFPMWIEGPFYRIKAV